MKRFFPIFMLSFVLLTVSCSDSGTTGDEPSATDPREECRFSNLKAVPAAESADFSAEYLYLGGFLVKENGFVCTPSGGGEPVTVVCERSTRPLCTLRDLKPETAYELYCYIVAGGRTFRSEAITFTTLAKGDEPAPKPEEKVTFGTLSVTERTASSVTVAVAYTHEGDESVTDAGFLLRKAGQSDEIRQSCGTATASLHHTFTGLSESTSYEVAAYVATPSKTWRSAPAAFTTEAGAVAPPAGDSKARYKGWAELPDEVTHAGWHYIYHMRPDKASVRNFSLCYSSEYRCTIWAAMAVHSSWNGEAGRNDAWKYDPALSSALQPNLKKTYSGVFRRGHMVASSDRQVSVETNRQTFYYTNMAPQYQNEFNGGIWNKLEKRIWSNYNCSDTLYVVTGAHFAHTNKTCNDADGQRVVVPTHFYKVLLRSKSGRTGKPVWELRADELQCVGFWLPHNDDYATTAPITAQYLVPVTYVEEQTGLRFFPNAPAAPKNSYDKAEWGY
ncbi:DNA/RNA non-specific endonuclease [Alistipes sp.]|uniref:DNA/RNA non-specific endonuclease n=1 Tax=Alistipes sp. TaxID=1872444 RepID=UPI003A858483